jgi:hypothetical protein
VSLGRLPLDIRHSQVKPSAQGTVLGGLTDAKTGRNSVMAVGDPAARDSVGIGKPEKSWFRRTLARFVTGVAGLLGAAAFVIAAVMLLVWGAPSAQAVPYTLTVSLEGAGSGTVTISPPGVTCPSDCSETYEQGTVVHLFAAPSADSEFVGWSGGGCAGSQAECSTTVNGDTNVTAVFDILIDSPPPDENGSPTPGDGPSPVPTETGTPPDGNGDDGDGPRDPWQRQIDRRLKALAQGGIAFIVPTDLKVGTESSVTVRISRNPSEDLLEGVETPGESEAVTVASVMAVELIGGGAFEIDPEGPQEQLVPPSGFSEWSWFVLPQESGDQTLRFIVSVVIQLPNGDEKARRIVRNREIHVSVNPAYQVGQFLLTYWPVLGGIIGLLFGSGVALRLINRRRGSDSPVNGRT